MTARAVAALAGAALAALAAGCAAPPPSDPAAVAAASRVTAGDDVFRGVRVVEGPDVQASTARGLLADRITWRLRIGTHPDTGAQRVVVQASVWHQDRRARHYRAATLPGGRTLPATGTDYDPRCMAGGGIVTCTHTESIVVALPPDAWADAQRAGLALRLDSRAGPSNVVTIPAAYAQGVAAAARR